MDKLEKHITNLREDFMKDSLNEAETQRSPFLQFKLWLQQAVDSKVPEAHAMNLATVSEDLKPSARIVYLREFENNRFWFYTNYQSKKAEELQRNPYAALTFFWPQLERQVRIEGIVEKATAKQSDNYYNRRPYESKIGAWASSQSRHLSSREELEQKVNDLKKELDPETIARPQFWGGLVLTASYYEFWQGRKSRLHDRICYTANSGDWNLSRIAP